MLETLLGGFSGPGALFMFAITAALAFGLAVAIERAWLFWVRWRIDEGALLSAVAQGDLASARAEAANHPVEGLVRAGADAPGPEAAWDAMSAKAALIEARVVHRVPYLAAVGNISTMLGLLGTVYGLIIAFTGLSDASAVERATRLSDGIATAMATTAWGLMVGIPALAVHAWFDGKAQRILALCEAVAAYVAASRREGA